MKVWHWGRRSLRTSLLSGCAALNSKSTWSLVLLAISMQAVQHYQACDHAGRSALRNTHAVQHHQATICMETGSVMVDRLFSTAKWSSRLFSTAGSGRDISRPFSTARAAWSSRRHETLHGFVKEVVVLKNLRCAIHTDMNLKSKIWSSMELLEISDFRFEISNFRFQISGFRF